MSFREAFWELISGHPIKVALIILISAYFLYVYFIYPRLARSSLLEPKWVRLDKLSGYEVYLRKADIGKARYWMKVGHLNVQIEVELEECGNAFKPRAIAGTEEKANPYELVSVFKIKEEN